MIYFILGLMVASIYAIIMGPTTLENFHDPLSFQTFSLFFFIIGGLLIIGLEYIKKFIKE